MRSGRLNLPLYSMNLPKLYRVSATVKNLAICSFIFMLIGIQPAPLQAQYSEIRSWRTWVDTLNQRIETMSAEHDTLKAAHRSLQARNLQLSKENEKLGEELRFLQSELEETRSEHLQTAHTRSILFILNLLAGFFLLVALIWIFYRRRTDKPLLQIKRTRRNGELEEDSLSRLEKLGNLREKGLLTEEEFNFQKRQLLGERRD